ncbi:3-phosphoshikimate 1-carboxyvinyltransferase [Robiginitalea sp. IMCC44478]|uniref:3-phosphoshikimate 1-carboxyvinyltransferase n=1 Tax=Robiginitalea sp. IMCC44478 TaxID=3459122 RepID=UPI004041E73C
MNLELSAPTDLRIQQSVQITGSKSETNRLLLLQALYPEITIENISNSDDARAMQQGLASSGGVVDIHHAGTAMRFLTAYFASREGTEVVLTGSARMKERPIHVLVEALRSMGADISYLETEGCPPLRIKGVALKESRVTLPADVSSQYISALLLIAPSLPEGLRLHLKGTITSVPYIQMTLGLLSRLGIQNSFTGNTVEVLPKQQLSPIALTVESDWSSASYYYSLMALSAVGSSVRLSAFREDSLQGDSVLPEIFRNLGVATEFTEGGIFLKHTQAADKDRFQLNMVKCPDLAQTIAVCCFGLGVGCDLDGLHTLKIKETDRLEALKSELTKLGAEISVTTHSLHLEPATNILEGQQIETFNDHRMAMAFAPLALKTRLIIADAGVVSKSYPGFWEDMEGLGLHLRQC